jgi:hypothetical protein
MNAYLLWHMRPLEGQEDLDREMDHVETNDKAVRRLLDPRPGR